MDEPVARTEPPEPAPAQHAEPRRDALLGAALVLLFGALYATTMCRTVYWYDSAELAATSATLGVPHPPGAPLYTLLGYALMQVFPGEPALIANATSAGFGALAVGMLFAVLRALGCGRIGAAIGAAALGATRLFWAQAVVAELYTLAMTMLLVVLWMLVRGLRTGSARWMVGAALVAGLSLGVHLLVATAGLGLALLVFAHRLEGERVLRRVFSREALGARLAVAAACVGAVALGASIHLYTLVRARMAPAISVGEPQTWERFSWYVTGGGYKSWFLEGVESLARLPQIVVFFYDQLLLAGLLIAVGGLIVLWRRRPLFGAAVVAIMAGNLGFFYDYNVHDLPVFLLPTLVALCVGVGFGVDGALAALRHPWFGERRAIAVLLGVLVCAAPVVALPLNHALLDLSDYREAQTWAEQVARELPPGAIVLSYGTPPEWQHMAVFHFYFQQVHGWRDDVEVVHAPEGDRLAGLIGSGRPVYLFAPVEVMHEYFRLVADGELYRIVRYDPWGRYPEDEPMVLEEVDHGR